MGRVVLSVFLVLMLTASAVIPAGQGAIAIYAGAEQIVGSPAESKDKTLLESTESAKVDTDAAVAESPISEVAEAEALQSVENIAEKSENFESAQPVKADDTDVAPEKAVLNDTAAATAETDDTPEAKTSAVISEAVASGKLSEDWADEYKPGDIKTVATAEPIANDTILTYSLEDSDVSFDSDENTNYVNNIIIVFFTNGTDVKRKSEIAASVGGRCVGYFDAVNQWQIEIEASTLEEIEEKCRLLEELDEVESAMCDYADEITTCAVPDDPWNSYSFDEESPAGGNWGIEAIEALSAWDYDEYFHHIDVGVVDNGVYLEHEDLNGVVQLCSEYASNNIPNNHGNSVAGIIGAKANNQVGSTGILWDTTILTVDTFPDSSAGQTFIASSMVYSGLIACVQEGAKVVNFSLGLTLYSTDTPATETRIASRAAEASDYMKNLLDAGYDFIVVQSAGNGYSDTHVAFDSIYNGFFCAVTATNTGKSAEVAKEVNDRIIIVGAAENLLDKCYQQAVTTTVASCGGPQVDICAPGRSIYSLSYTEANPSSSYGTWTGTSMAAPIVAAVCALTWSVNPTLTAAQVRDIVIAEENTPYVVADNTSSQHPLVDTYRMVNAKCSVLAAIETLPKLVPDSNTSIVVDNEKHLIYGIEERMTSTSFTDNYISEISGGGHVDFIMSTSRLGTGSVVNVCDSDNNIIDSYTVIVFGDIDGNGTVNTADLSIANAGLTEGIEDEFVRTAANVVLMRKNDLFNAIDLSALFDAITNDGINQAELAELKAYFDEVV